MFPSSQISLIDLAGITSLTPLPQNYVHIVPEQSHPESIIQFVHPSLSITLPSSHYSPASNDPFPQIKIQALIYNDTALHIQSGSIWHDESHPSPLEVLPSSHYSVYDKAPSLFNLALPHKSVHYDGNE